MPQREQSHINQVQVYRPLCSKCGTPTQLACIEPSEESGYDLRTFECIACGNSDVARIKFE